MIQPGDLRPGNLINTPSGIQKITGYQTGQVNVIYFKEGHIGRHMCDAIPLTSEWLEWCGFKRGGQHSDRNVFYPTGIHRINIELSGNDEYSYLLDGNLIKGYARIKYVHQLQNLYFALTGAELEIKLP